MAWLAPGLVKLQFLQACTSFRRETPDFSDSTFLQVYFCNLCPHHKLQTEAAEPPQSGTQ